jgi:hypothetical protein
MLIFCDESGDPGLSIKSGSSSYFAIAMLHFADGETAARLAEAQEKTRVGLRWSGEFKWSKMPSDVRMAYLTAMAPLLVAHRVAIWDKQRGPLPSGYRPEVAVMLHCYDAFGFHKPAVRIVIDG